MGSGSAANLYDEFKLLGNFVLPRNEQQLTAVMDRLRELEVLMQAIRDGNLSQVRGLVTPANVNGLDAQNMTPLMLAAREGKLDIVAHLMSVHGVDVQYTLVDGSSAFTHAANSEILRSLLEDVVEHSAAGSVDEYLLITNVGARPLLCSLLDRAIRDGNFDKFHYLLMIYCRLGLDQHETYGLGYFFGLSVCEAEGLSYLDIVKHFVDELKVDVNQKISGDYLPSIFSDKSAMPLMVAVVAGRLDLVELLLDHGAVYEQAFILNDYAIPSYALDRACLDASVGEQRSVLVEFLAWKEAEIRNLSIKAALNTPLLTSDAFISEVVRFLSMFGPISVRDGNARDNALGFAIWEEAASLEREARSVLWGLAALEEEESLEVRLRKTLNTFWCGRRAGLLELGISKSWIEDVRSLSIRELPGQLVQQQQAALLGREIRKDEVDALSVEERDGRKAEYFSALADHMVRFLLSLMMRGDPLVKYSIRGIKCEEGVQLVAFLLAHGVDFCKYHEDDVTGLRGSLLFETLHNRNRPFAFKKELMDKVCLNFNAAGILAISRANIYPVGGEAADCTEEVGRSAQARRNYALLGWSRVNNSVRPSAAAPGGSEG